MSTCEDWGHTPDFTAIKYADGYLTVACADCGSVGELSGNVNWPDASSPMPVPKEA